MYICICRYYMYLSLHMYIVSYKHIYMHMYLSRMHSTAYVGIYVYAIPNSRNATL